MNDVIITFEVPKCGRRGHFKTNAHFFQAEDGKPLLRIEQDSINKDEFDVVLLTPKVVKRLHKKFKKMKREAECAGN